MSNAPSRSHETSLPPPPPVASSTGSSPVSNNDKAPSGSDITAESHSSRSRVLCRFYATKKGCRAVDQCPYRHVDVGQSKLEPPLATSIQPFIERAPVRPAPPITRELPQGRRDNVSGPRAVAPKPVPDVQKLNPREFQINQVVKRFSPHRQDAADGSTLQFKLAPSDPDFPFELNGLECELIVPADYPQTGKPRLRVKNKEIPRGYQINVENGFDSLVNPRRTLLALTNELDKNLETFLTTEKAQTIKIVWNASKDEASKPSAHQAVLLKSAPDQEVAVPLQAGPEYTPDQLSVARSKRDADIRQLEARMSRIPQFSKSSDGKTFSVPMQIPKPGRLAPSLRDLKVVTLTVPSLYNLEPCAVKLNGVVGDEVQKVEMAFERHARQDPDMTLMAHINYLTQHMHLMALEASFQPLPPALAAKEIAKSNTHPELRTTLEQQTEDRVVDADRPHIKFVPRPPEWDLPRDDSEEDSSGFEDSEEYTGSEDENDEAQGGTSLPGPTTTATVSGNSILISFPGIELFSIELLELVLLALTLKCDRCKSTVDIKNLRSSPSDNSSLVTLTESCPKCAATLAASYHAEPLHANSIKAGHLDLISCTVSDMLPSTFTPTCSECSTPYPTPPGVVSVRGETTLAVCRSCHRKMTFKIPEVKFLRVAAHASGIPLPPRRRKVKENLGIVAGTPLPNFGKCSHYRKSHRWFRFSCCNKVFPCDRCHDEQAEPKHPNEHANRMICGYCSREQNYRPEDCGVCRRSLVGRRGGGFWEGGKGTRDKLRMSRKDPRKYKRRGGTAVGGA